MENILITEDIDKEPYIKIFTEDKVINLTGESGSGKSYYSKRWENDDNYIIIDTDLIFGKRICDKTIYNNLRQLVIQKYGEEYQNAIIDKFDECYEMILNYFKDIDKTLVIDSAQFRNMKDISKLKGKIIIMRTCINNCYLRCIDRYKNRNLNASEEEINVYSERKRRMYQWYKKLNEFILKVDKL